MGSEMCIRDSCLSYCLCLSVCLSVSLSLSLSALVEFKLLYSLFNLIMLAADLMLIPHFSAGLLNFFSINQVYRKKGEGVVETKGVKVKILEKNYTFTQVI